MKKQLIALLMLVLGVLAFGLGARQALTEEEALALIDQKLIRLEATLEDRAAAEEAFQALVQARVRVQNAYRIVSDAIEGGLRAKEMTALRTQTQAKLAAGASSGDCEDAAKAMVREQLRAMEQLRTQSKDQTKTGESKPGMPESAGSGSGK
ncbi:MAG TPA: hypothetical protein DCG47_00430 [Spirochaetaceae bacterium]|jgi:bacterioferritin-associated ferredoxin|nr:hypothetical protein [Spirochaetaceae bacterium]